MLAYEQLAADHCECATDSHCIIVVSRLTTVFTLAFSTSSNSTFFLPVVYSVPCCCIQVISVTDNEQIKFLTVKVIIGKNWSSAFTSATLLWFLSLRHLEFVRENIRSGTALVAGTDRTYKTSWKRFVLSTALIHLNKSCHFLPTHLVQSMIDCSASLLEENSS